MNKKLLAQALAENEIAATALQIEKLMHFLKLLEKWNRVFNLTALQTPKEMVYLHIIDSLTLLPHIEGKRILDVGSGGGLPGVPLAIMQPDKQWVLLDKSQKKTRFLMQLKAELQLDNVDVMVNRVEDFNASQCFDTILARAFAELGQFLRASAHLLCPDGLWIAMKGKYPEQELANLPKSVTLVQSIPVQIKGIEVNRHLLFFRMAPESK